MPRRFPLPRPVTLLFAVLQLSLQALAVLADARVEARSGVRVTSHVEREGSPCCPPVHRPDCVLCQHVGTRAMPPVGTPQLTYALAGVRPPDASQRIAAVGGADRTVFPRAPPLP